MKKRRSTVLASKQGSLNHPEELLKEKDKQK
jgi:hypothetical protein